MALSALLFGLHYLQWGNEWQFKQRIEVNTWPHRLIPHASITKHTDDRFTVHNEEDCWWPWALRSCFFGHAAVVSLTSELCYGSFYKDFGYSRKITSSSYSVTAFPTNQLPKQWKGKYLLEVGAACGSEELTSPFLSWLGCPPLYVPFASFQA